MNATVRFRRTLSAILHWPQKSKQAMTPRDPPPLTERYRALGHSDNQDPFPTEIWELIIKQCSTKEWVALCRTCWLFLQITRECLYKKIALSGKPFVHSLLGHSLPRFESSLMCRRELGTLVHDLFLLVERNSPQSAPILLMHLDELPNLKIFRAQFIFIDSQLFYSLHSLPFLTTVSLSYCKLEDSIADLETQQFPSSSISDLQIDHDSSHVTDYNGWAALAPVGLRSLRVSSPIAGVEVILSSIRRAGKDHMLEKLSITHLPQSAVEFLITSTQLRHLKLDCVIDTHHAIFASLPVDAIPLLEQYSGPVELCELLLRNRPVHTVALIRTSNQISSDGYVKLFATLRLSSASITELTVVTVPVGPWLWDVPITVRDLEFILKKEAFLGCLPALSHLTNLHIIRSSKHQREENLSREELMQVSESCPSIREFYLWYERWCMVKPNVWELFDM